MTSMISRSADTDRNLSRTYSLYKLSSDEYDKNEHGTFDYLVENQRGWILMGFPFFSGNSLLPWDRQNWTTLDGHPSPGISEHLLPSISWRWGWKRWYVDMSGDVDDQGWAYAWRFGSSTWHGSHIWFRSFVRRRIWKRLREKMVEEEEQVEHHLPTHLDILANVQTGTNQSEIVLQSQLGFQIEQGPLRVFNQPSQAIPSSKPSRPTLADPAGGIQTVDELSQQIKTCRIDRERIQLIERFVKLKSVELLRQLQSRIAEILDKFEFPDSRQHLVVHLQAAVPSCDSASRKARLHDLIAAVKEYNLRSAYYSEETERKVRESNGPKGKQTVESVC